MLLKGWTSGGNAVDGISRSRAAQNEFENVAKEIIKKSWLTILREARRASGVLSARFSIGPPSAVMLVGGRTSIYGREKESAISAL